jgi:hypothetical protein
MMWRLWFFVYAIPVLGSWFWQHVQAQTGEAGTVLPPTTQPPPPGTPNLPLGDIQVLIVTDVHSWIGGHGDKEAPIDADYGDVLSFFRRLKAQLAPTGRDLVRLVHHFVILLFDSTRGS